MLADRIRVALILVPAALLLFWLGGPVFVLGVVVTLVLASLEFTRLYEISDLHTGRWLLPAGVAAIILAQALGGLPAATVALTVATLISMTFHTIRYERGRDHAAGDWLATMGGLLYFGWLGRYAILMREPEHGLGFLLLAVGIAVFEDMGGYFIGSRWGRHRMTKRLSPRKTWEGFAAGVAGAVLGAALMTGIYSFFYPDFPLPVWMAAVIGLALGILLPLGDLGASMVKRMAHAKDSGQLLPGHGGAWDRIDTWMWAVPLTYYALQIWVVWLGGSGI